jgi:hypothetical protein
MADLSASVEGRLHTEIAFYFGVSVVLIEEAILNGAKTYSDVHNYINKEKINAKYEPNSKPTDINS